MKIQVLGTEYELLYKGLAEEKRLAVCDGFMDSSSKRCVVCDMADDGAVMRKDDVKAYRDKVARHEIIHAFLEESGLAQECQWNTEEMTDWWAIQFPKVARAFKAAGVTDA